MVIESSYKNACDIFTKEKVLRRYMYLKDRIEYFLNSTSRNSVAFVAHEILGKVVVDYFDDISRLKDYHKIENTNKEKIIAYTASWLCRHKPLQYMSKPIKPEDFSINELFVSSYVSCELSYLSQKEPSDIFKKHLLYHLTYRAFDAKSLELAIKSYLDGADFAFK